MWRRGIVAALCAIAVAALAVVSVMPTTEESYVSAVANSIEQTRSAVQTAAQVSSARAQNNVTKLYADVAIDDALDNASTSLDDLLAEEVPTARAGALRDAAVPLLSQSASLINDAARANHSGEDRALTTTSADLRAVADKLTEVLGQAR